MVGLLEPAPGPKVFALESASRSGAQAFLLRRLRRDDTFGVQWLAHPLTVWVVGRLMPTPDRHATGTVVD